MPIVVNTENARIRAANTVMSRAYFPRAKKWLYTELCGTYISTSLVEPHAIIGSVPPLQRFSGQLKSAGIPSYSSNIPNELYKNVFHIDQTDLEADQTRTLMQLSTATGVRTAEFPDMLFASKLLKGSVTGDVTAGGSVTHTFRGTSYTITIDGVPFFDDSHPTPGLAAGVQSNQIEGSLPTTLAEVNEQSWAESALQMQRDLLAVINAVQTIVDTQGVPLFPSLDPKSAFTVVVPPGLAPIAALAFTTGNGAIINQTTNIAPMYVKKVISSGFLAGLPDPDNANLKRVSPLNATDWYVLIDDDYVKPFYWQIYRPPTGDELFPRGYNAEAEINRIMKANSDITVAEATVYASTRIDTTFARIGEQADAYTIENEQFLVSARSRGNIVYGPWFTGWRIYPSGGTA